jgi:hypothetical protein
MNDNNEAPVVTLRGLMEEKFANAKKSFGPVADRVGLTKELNELELDELLAGLLSNSLMWSIFEHKETEFLLSLAEGAKTEENAADVDRFVAGVRQLTAAEQDLGWRYVNFFLKCLKN